MAMNLANNPFLLGQMQGYMEQSKETSKMEAEKAAKAREQFVQQANSEISQLKDLMAASKTPEQRAAAQKIAEAMKESYAGGVADQYGVKDVLIRQIDMASQNPYNQKDMESGLGSSPAVIQLQNALANEQDPLKRQELQNAITLKSTGLPPTNTVLQNKQAAATGTAMGKDYQDVLNQAVDAPVKLAQLDSVEKAVDSLPDARQGPIAGRFWDLSEEAQKIGGQSVIDSLSYVNQTKGAISDKEMALFRDASVSTSNDKKINKERIAASKAALIRTMQQADFFEKWNELNGNLEGAYNAFKEYADKNPILKIKNGDFVLELDGAVEDIQNDKTYLKYLKQEQPTRSFNGVDIPMLNEGMLDGSEPYNPPVVNNSSVDYKSKYGLQ